MKEDRKALGSLKTMLCPSRRGSGSHYHARTANATRSDPKSPDPIRPNLISITDSNFFQEVDVTTSMTLDLQVPPNPLKK
jgi:hypothetical protein